MAEPKTVEIARVERAFHDPGWKLDENGEVVRRDVKGKPASGSNEEYAVLSRIDELRDDDLASLDNEAAVRRVQWRKRRRRGA